MSWLTELFTGMDNHKNHYLHIKTSEQKRSEAASDSLYKLREELIYDALDIISSFESEQLDCSNAIDIMDLIGKANNAIDNAERIKWVINEKYSSTNSGKKIYNNNIRPNIDDIAMAKKALLKISRDTRKCVCGDHIGVNQNGIR